MRKMEVTWGKVNTRSNNLEHHFHTQSREYRTEVEDHKGYIINEAILKHKQHQ